MGAIKDVYDISIDVVKFINKLFQSGLKKRKIKTLLKTCLVTGSLPRNIDQLLDDAERVFGQEEINTQTLRRISASVKEMEIRHKVSAKKKPAAKKKIAAKKLAR